MGYPYYPNNRLVVNNVDLTEKFKMVLVDGYTLSPPEPKTYEVDIPGGNGKLDLTESLLGDTAYGYRKQEFEFYLIDVKDFEKVKTEVSNLLHGKSYYYSMSMDQGYTYKGRFSVTSYTHNSYTNGKVGIIKISINADPYKFKEPREETINAVGGKICIFKSGRKRVRPVIETHGSLKVIYNGTLVNLPSGSWTIDGLLFEMGENEAYFNSYDIHNLTWGDLKTDGVTWGQFKEQKLFEWYKSKGTGTIVWKTWNDLADLTWENLSTSAWSDLSYISEISEDVKDIHIQYDWGDL